MQADKTAKAILKEIEDAKLAGYDYPISSLIALRQVRCVYLSLPSQCALHAGDLASHHMVSFVCLPLCNTAGKRTQPLVDWRYLCMDVMLGADSDDQSQSPKVAGKGVFD